MKKLISLIFLSLFAFVVACGGAAVDTATTHDADAVA